MDILEHMELSEEVLLLVLIGGGGGGGEAPVSEGAGDDQDLISEGDADGGVGRLCSLCSLCTVAIDERSVTGISMLEWRHPLAEAEVEAEVEASASASTDLRLCLQETSAEASSTAASTSAPCHRFAGELRQAQAAPEASRFNGDNGSRFDGDDGDDGSQMGGGGRAAGPEGELEKR